MKEIEVQECKIFFDPEITAEQAKAVIKKYTDSPVDNYMEKRYIGSNIVSFAIMTLPLKAANKMVDDPKIKRVDVITTFKQANTECGDCGCGP